MVQRIHRILNPMESKLDLVEPFWIQRFKRIFLRHGLIFSRRSMWEYSFPPITMTESSVAGPFIKTKSAVTVKTEPVVDPRPVKNCLTCPACGRNSSSFSSCSAQCAFQSLPFLLSLFPPVCLSVCLRNLCKNH